MLITVLFTLLLFAPNANQTAKPNGPAGAAGIEQLAGQWTVDLEKTNASNPTRLSVSRGGPLPTILVHVDASNFVIVQKKSGGDVTLTYHLNGSPNSNRIPYGSKILDESSTARWQASALEILAKQSGDAKTIRYYLKDGFLVEETTTPRSLFKSADTFLVFYRRASSPLVPLELPGKAYFNACVANPYGVALREPAVTA